MYRVKRLGVYFETQRGHDDENALATREAPARASEHAGGAGGRPLAEEKGPCPASLLLCPPPCCRPKSQGQTRQD